METTTGAVNVVEQFVWNPDISIIWNIEGAINSGVAWSDYISISPYKQPNMIWNTSDENNKIMWVYLSKYKSEFTIPANKTNGYIIFITSKEIAEDRDMFLWIRWTTEWILYKNKSIKGAKSNRYIYNMKNISVANYKNWINLFDKDINWKIQIGAFVGEKDNRIEKIIIVLY